MAQVDVLIQTHNEEVNLPHTLASVKGWANRIFVVDSGSTDQTLKIAADGGATVVHHAWEGYAAQKNWALSNLPFESDWVLILDADEAVSPELRREINAVVSQPADSIPEAGFYINRIFIFMGRQIRHCGYFPSWNLRLFKRGRARYENRLVHEHMIVDGPTGYLENLLLHEDRRGLEHFFAKHNRYSSLEAREIWESPEPWPGVARFFSDRVTRRRFVKSRVMPRLPVPWMWRLIYMYIIRFGFLDGHAGWVLSNFISTYEFLIAAKFKELRRLKGRPVISSGGLSQAEGQISELTPLQILDPTRVSGTVRAGAASSNGHTVAPHAVETETRLPRGAIVGQGETRTRGQGEPEFRHASPWTLRQNIGRVLWMLASTMLFRTSFHNWYGWRRFLLRCFGATIGKDVRIRPTTSIEIPWTLDIGDGAIVGDYAILYSLGTIKIGRFVVISQYAHLCAGTHDYRVREFPLVRPPIVVGDEAWIAADAFVGPGVTIGRRAILGARASAFSDIPPNMIAGGSPAKAIKVREPFPDELPELAAPVPATDLSPTDTAAPESVQA